jgi:serine/threonine-protein kinase
VAGNRDDALSATVQAPAKTFARSTVLPRAKAPAPADKPRFQPIDSLGAGGVGEVVLVEDQDIERKVAIKRLKPEQEANPEAVHRFADEVRIVGQLEHPNIAPVHDVGIDEEGRHYFVMKYVEGETLEAVIDKLRAGDAATVARFDHEARIELFLGMLNAVAYAHARGIVHRDLKPSNVMIGPFGEVTVMDWGVAKRVGDREELQQPSPAATANGTLLGTPLYMSPEQAAGEHATLDARSDIFSLSLIFYELMTLEHPLRDLKTVQLVIAQLITSGIETNNLKSKFIAARAPCEYGQLLKRGLAHDRAQRFASVNEMIAALHRLRAGDIPVSCPVTFGRRMSAKTGRLINNHPFAYVIVAVTGLLTLGWLAFRELARLLH